MNPRQQQHHDALADGIFAEASRQSVTEWCCSHLRFDEPGNRGPFSIHGREYIREPLDQWADTTVSDHVDIFGSQAGKTGIVMGGVAWTVANRPSRILWVMPTRDDVTDFASERWVPMLQASPAFAGKIPEGRDRHKMTRRHQHIGGSIISQAWSNSPSALASKPCRVVVLDEVDKFNEGTRRETNAVNLAEQRTKSFSDPKRHKSTTPSLTTGLGWQEFLKTDQRRRFLSCPHCGRSHPTSRQFVLAWSRNYTVFRKTGEEAFITWDKEAKRADGTWDLDRVEKSARAECPHCGGHILDGMKTRLDREGQWRPTAIAAKGYRGHHLPSLYAASAGTAFGKLAVKFLQAKAGMMGVQGFINGDLAEPYQAQDTLGQRVELITSKLEVTAEWRKLLTIDCQQKAPEFWHVVRAWNGKTCEGLQAGPLSQWCDIEAVQRSHNIPNVQVAVDSGWGAKSDSEVYTACAERADLERRQDKLPLLVGWNACKGMPGNKRWRDDETKSYMPWNIKAVDPYGGKSDAGQVQIILFEFAGDYYKDILAAMRQRKDGWDWKISADIAQGVELEEYWRHLDGEIKTAKQGPTGHTKWTWVARHRQWPNHLFDCEVLQVAFAGFLKLTSYES